MRDIPYTSQDAWEAVKYFFVDELPAFKALIASLPPHPLVVNIGAGAGVSGLAVLETREDATLHTIDITDESSPFGCLAGERQVVELAGLSHRLNVSWFQHHGDSKEIGKTWDRPCDLVYVDGDHSWMGAVGDITIWKEHVKPGGLMAVHDYAKEAVPPWPWQPEIKGWAGVTKAVDGLLRPDWEFVWIVDSLIVFRKPEE